MKLLNPTDAELNAAFAEHVAWWTQWTGAGGVPLGTWHDSEGDKGKARFTTSADAVLPWLEKWRFEATFWKCWQIRIICWETHGENKFGEADNFAKAAVIALLRAHGVQVEFQPSAQATKEAERR